MTTHTTPTASNAPTNAGETPRNHVLGALQGIANLHGNLPLLPLYEACGPNEGTLRGIKLATAIEMARQAIPLCEDQAAQLTAERAAVGVLREALEGIVAMSPSNYAPPLQLRARDALRRIVK